MMQVAKSKTSLNRDWLAYDAGPPIVMAGLAVAELAWPGFSQRFAAWPFLISLAIVGMPHGATDWNVNRRLSGSLSNAVRTFAVYCLVLATSLGCFLAAPRLSIALFGLFTVLHFGLADARDTSPVASRGLTLAAAVARGLMILAAPFFFHSADSWAVVGGVLGIAGDALPGTPDPMNTWAAVALVAAMGLELATVAVRYQDGQTSAATKQLVEWAVLLIAFLALDPLFAMGAYLVVWHGWRHLRVADFSHKDVGIIRRVLRTYRTSAPLLIPTLVLFAVAAWRLEANEPWPLAILTIAAYVVVTPAHHLLVERLAERRAVHRPHKEILA